MAEISVKLTIGYTDETKKQFSISPIEPSAAIVSQFKAKIKAVNNDWDSVYNLSSILQNEEGASATGIVEASMTLESETKVNLSSETAAWNETLYTEFGSDTGSTSMQVQTVDGNGTKLYRTYSYVNPAVEAENVDYVGRAFTDLSNNTYVDSILSKSWSVNEILSESGDN